MTSELITALKNILYIPAGLIVATFAQESYLILVILMTLDTVLGVTRVIMVHGGEHVLSYRLASGVISKLTFIAIPVSIALAGRGIGLDLVFLADWAVSMLILAHLYSIIGNVYSIHIRQDVQEFDAVSMILRSLQVVIERLIKADKHIQDTNLRHKIQCKKTIKSNKK